MNFVMIDSEKIFFPHNLQQVVCTVSDLFRQLCVLKFSTASLPATASGPPLFLRMGHLYDSQHSHYLQNWPVIRLGFLKIHIII